MPKPSSRPYSQYSLDAMQLIGQLIREGRLSKALTAADLAARVGISRSLLQRIERGDASCSIGVVFEAAAICGVPLFGLDQRLLSTELARQSEKMSLLPKAVRVSTKGVHDDF